jgi:glycosyltransferase involved in cell wall biosynthesis
MATSLPTISIVTASYNSAPYVEEAIQSVAKQDYPNKEHIIFDGESTDDTIDILNRYDHLSHLRWVSEPDEGQSDALNKGMREATGDVIGWLNADDRYLPGCFRTVADHFESNADTDVLYGNYRWIDADGTVFQERRELDFDLFMLKYVDTLYIPSEALFIRRRVIEDGEFIDPSYDWSMDYEYILRLALKGYTFAHVNEFLSDFRWHDESKTGTAAPKQNEDRIRALLAHDPHLRSCPESVRPAARKLLEWSARGKRYFLKALRGYYFSQWTPTDQLPSGDQTRT